MNITDCPNISVFLYFKRQEKMICFDLTMTKLYIVIIFMIVMKLVKNCVPCHINRFEPNHWIRFNLLTGTLDVLKMLYQLLYTMFWNFLISFHLLQLRFNYNIPLVSQTYRSQDWPFSVRMGTWFSSRPYTICQDVLNVSQITSLLKPESPKFVLSRQCVTVFILMIVFLNILVVRLLNMLITLLLLVWLTNLNKNNQTKCWI